MWLGIWASRRKGEPKWEKFKTRYFEFHPADCVLLCPNHHAEIHKLYDEIIQADRKFTQRPLSKYTWKQAEILMNKLSNKCDEWLEIETPGISYEKFAETRR